MGELVLGIIAAMGASTLYSLGVAFQAMDAKQTSRQDYLRLGLARDLLRRSRWLLGTGLSMLGWPLQLLALTLAPLVVVQPAMAAGLLVLLLLAERMLHEHAGRREHLAVCAILLGVLGTALTAPPRTTTHASNAVLTVVLVLLALASVLPYIWHIVRRPPATVTMIGAGMGFAWSGVATKLASDDLAHGHVWLAVAWGISTAIASAIAALSEMSALQSRPAIQVAPVVFVTQTAVPVALAPLLLGERFTSTPLGGVPLALSLAVLIGASAVLARSPLLLALMEPEPKDLEGEPRDGPMDMESEARSGETEPARLSASA
jgi:drug/metabolite transporter (DMT)-like permease